MYKIFNGKEWVSFRTYEQLLNYLSRFNKDVIGGSCNSFLEMVGTNGNDTVYHVTFKGFIKHSEYKPRTYRIINEDGNNIFDKYLVKDVINWKYSEVVNRQWLEEKWAKQKQNYYRGWKGGIPDSAYPEFRRGSWPYVHHRRHYKVYRMIKTTNEKRLTCNDEHKEFNRGTRGKNLPDAWSDEPLRNWRNSGWKKQGKNRHQWEHGVKTKAKHIYGKGLYVCKEYPISYENEPNEIEDISITDGVAG